MSVQVIRYFVNIIDPIFLLMGAFIILGEDIKKLWLKAVVFSFVLGTFVWFTDNMKIDLLRLLINVVVYFLLLKYLLRLNNWLTIKTFIISYLLGLFTNSIVYFIIIYGLRMEPNQLTLPSWFWLKVYLPAEFLNLLTALAISKLRSKVLYLFAKFKGSLSLTKALDLTRILGNLIDNAIEATEQLSPSEKWIKVTIYEKGPLLVVSVLNPGSPPAESTAKLSEPGFTTKDDRHSGLGLYICSQLAKKLHGKIDYKYDLASGVSFSLIIPKSR